MKEFVIAPNEAGQRFDKYLKKLLPGASAGFVFKMLRKKNIVLNGKKAAGNEMLSVGDQVRLFLADETFEKFAAGQTQGGKALYVPYSKTALAALHLEIVYEDEAILIFNKPAGMLSQKSAITDVSVNEYLIGYLLFQKELSEEELKTFRPSAANRLDRNTSGLILCGKSLAGLQYLSEIIKNRTLEKYYCCIVERKLEKELLIEGYLSKDPDQNRVFISDRAPEGKEASFIKTGINPIGQYTWRGQSFTELSVHLITGKPHQIRAHLASIGHPIVGDPKYGRRKEGAPGQGTGNGGQSALEKKCHVKRQLLHSRTVIFPETEGAFAYMSGKRITAAFSPDYEKVRKELQHGNVE